MYSTNQNMDYTETWQDGDLSLLGVDQEAPMYNPNLTTYPVYSSHYVKTEASRDSLTTDLENILYGCTQTQFTIDETPSEPPFKKQRLEDSEHSLPPSGTVFPMVYPTSSLSMVHQNHATVYTQAQKYVYSQHIPQEFDFKKNALLRPTCGIDCDSSTKYLGGKNNNQHFMPCQIIELAYDMLPDAYKEHEGRRLTCRASVLGFDKSKRSMVVLGKVSNDKHFVQDKSTNRYFAQFDDVLVQFASHNYGQRLCLKFELLDQGYNVLSEHITKEFQTITKRGLEKEVQRETLRNINNEKKRKASFGKRISSMEPCAGACGQLVKITFTDDIMTSPEDVEVHFGDMITPRVYYAKNDLLVCETPNINCGTYQVCVSIKRGDQIEVINGSEFQFLDSEDPGTPTRLVDNLFRKR